LERSWCIAYQRGKNALAIGFDEGCVVVKMGREEPAVSMDASGKLVWARHNEVLSAVIKQSGEYLLSCFLCKATITNTLGYARCVYQGWTNAHYSE
jgi:hypothetical protein